MKNRLLALLTGLFSVIVSIQAQDCTYYFPVKPGSVRVMNSYKSNDKLTASVKTVIIENKGNSVKFNSESFDAKGKSIYKGDFEVKCEKGEFVLDWKSYLNMDMSKFKDMEMKIDGKALSIPPKLTVGQKHNDGDVNITIGNNGMTFMTISTKITNRTVEGFENITTAAGTFKCAKITADVESHTMFTIHTKTVEWISEKIGVVRTESLDKEGKLQSYSVLTSFSE
jgi:hypothetical protein